MMAIEIGGDYQMKLLQALSAVLLVAGGAAIAPFTLSPGSPTGARHWLEPAISQNSPVERTHSSPVPELVMKQLAANCHQECTPRTKEVCEPVQACTPNGCIDAQQCHQEPDGEDCTQVCDPDPPQG
jgi:hypothetical protein